MLRSHLIAHNLDVSIKRGETNESKISRLTALAATKESERHGVSFRNKLPELFAMTQAGGAAMDAGTERRVGEVWGSKLLKLSSFERDK